MSRTIHADPLAGEGFHFIHQATWAVQQPGSDDDAPSLVGLADGITERLANAAAAVRRSGMGSFIYGTASVGWDKTTETYLSGSNKKYSHSWGRYGNTGEMKEALF